MKIAIAGGTGFLGRMLRRHLRDEGHVVWLLVRRPDLDAVEKQVLWDGKTGGAWTDALAGSDAIINLCGRSVNCRYHAMNRAEIYASRLDPTRAISEALAVLPDPPSVWLNASSATIYRHTEDRPMDESSGEIGSGFSVDVCRRWESTLFESRLERTRRVALRTAMVMSHEPGGAFHAYADLVRKGLGGPMAGGRQFVSWIHEADFVRAVSFLLETESLDGAVNLAAPGPLPNAEFMAALREALDKRRGMPTPSWMIRLGCWLRQTEPELVLKSRRVVPGRLLEAGFAFRYPAWPEAARSLA